MNVYSVPIYSSNETAIAKFPTISILGVNDNELSLNTVCLVNISNVGSHVCSFEYPLGNSLVTSSSYSYGSCFNMGNYNYANVQNSLNLESGLKLTSSSSYYSLKPHEILVINSNSNQIIFNQNLTKDSKNHIKNFIYSGYNLGTGGSSVLNGSIANNTYLLMDSMISCLPYVSEPKELTSYYWDCDGSSGDSTFHGYAFLRMFIINTSYSGIINYNVSIGSITFDTESLNHGTFYEIGYSQFGSLSKTIISNSQTSNGNLSLNPNTLYIFYLLSEGTGKGYGLGVHANCQIYEGDYNTSFKINIATPNWNCGNYGECINGIKSRLCHDLNGFLNDYIDNQACYSLPDKSINIGFEDRKTVNVFYSYPYDWWLPIINCPYCIAYKEVEYPSDWNLWNISNPQITNNATGCSEPTTGLGYVYDNLKMTNEYATNGIYSLKLWYLPPETAMPYCPDLPNSLCVNGSTTELNAWGNTTIGYFPELHKDINESFMVSKDITFDYPNMTITMDIKKCNEPEKQYSGNTSVLGSCGEGYYTHDKTINWDVKPTNIFLNIYDYNSSQTIMNIKFVSTLNKWQKFQVRLLNLTTSDLYRFALNLFPNDYPVDSDVYCAYIDNVNLNAYSGSVPCQSHCGDKSIGEIPSTFYKVSQTSENACSFLEEQVSPNCIGIKHIIDISGCGQFCNGCNVNADDYLVYYQGNNETGICEWTLTENASYCIDYCNNQNIGEVNTLETTINVLLPFFSPIFLITYVIFAIGAVLAAITKHWEVFSIAVIVGFLIAGTVWIEMAFIAICIIVCVAYFLSKEHGKSNK
jgi:hypothetical protein